jgi:hypothetical protein
MVCSVCLIAGHNARSCAAKAAAAVVAAVKPPLVEERTKRNAKAHEDADIDALIAHINSTTSASGARLRDAYATKFGAPLTAARRSDPTAHGKRVGGRGVHYDFQIQAGERWLNVEHKGSKTYAPIDPELPPWTGGVQFYNGGMEKYRLARRYAEAWHAKYVGSGVLKERYGLKATIPSLEDWIAKDARVQGKPKTPFGKELKNTYQALPGCAGKSLTKERDEFVEEFFGGLSSADCVSLAEDLSPLVRDSLGQKDVWLQIAGDVAKDFHFAWSPQLRVDRIKCVNFKKGRDVEIGVECECPSGEFKFGGILRWGYGAGFSNLRLDLR